MARQITLSYEVSAEEEARVVAMLAAASEWDAVYNGERFVIARGDYTEIPDTDGLRDAEVLFAAIQSAVEGWDEVNWPFDDCSQRNYVPLPHGGFAAV